MILHEINVCFKKQDGSWGFEERYIIDNKRRNLEKNILSTEAPLVEAVLELEVNQIGKLPNGEQFLLVNKEATYVLEDYLDNIGNVLTYNDKKLINISYDFPKLVSEAININENVKELFDLIITAKLNNEDIDACLLWLNEVKKTGIYVDDVTQKLNLIKKEQKGLYIDDINHVYTLSQISDLYKDLKAIKKAKKILLKALQIDNYNPYTLNRLGKVSRLLCSYQEGIDYYRKAIDVKETVYSYNGLGAIYREIGDFPKAEQCYTSSLNLKEKYDHRYTHRGLGAVYYDMELYNEGNKHFKLAGYDENFLMQMYYAAKRNNLQEKEVNILRLILEFDRNHTKARDILNQEIGYKNRDEEQDFSFSSFLRSNM